MSSTVFINVYESYVDRGATVSSTPSEHYEVMRKTSRLESPCPSGVRGALPL